MAVNLPPPNPADLHPVPGVDLGAAMAGVRKANRKDLLVMRLAPGSSVAGVFTRNRFCAAPVTLAKKHLKMLKSIKPHQWQYLREDNGDVPEGGPKPTPQTNRIIMAQAV